jgi:hypothetical protein
MIKKGTCKNIIERSVDENTLITSRKEKNINISLKREKTNVFNAAFIVYILDE